MKNKSYLLLGAALMASLFWLVLGAAAPAPVQRNQFTTNVQGQPIIGDFIISNAVAGSGTNFVINNSQGAISLAPGSRQLWKLYGWGSSGPQGDSAMDWFGSLSRLSTNGGVVINAHAIDLNSGGSALFTGSISNTTLTASRAVVTDANQQLTSASGTPTGSKFLRDDNTYAVPAGGVTSIGLTVPSNLAGTNGGNITGTGQLSWTNVFQSANTIFAGPGSGSKAEPAFRALVASDLPAGSLTTSLLGSNIMVLTDGSTNLVSAGVSNLVWASTVDINLNVGPYQYLIMTNDTTFTSSRLGAAKAVAVKIFAGSTNYNLTFPSWTFLGAGAPTLISSNKTAILSLTAWDGNTTNVIAAWAVQP